MAKKKNKLTTPAWITKGYDSLVEYEKANGGKVKEKKSKKTFNLRLCPKCGSDEVSVVLGEVGMWKCEKCGYKGQEIGEKELSEDEFMQYLDSKEEDVA